MMFPSSYTYMNEVIQVKIWFQNRRMKWKRERRGEELSDEGLDSRIMEPEVTGWNNQFFFP